MPVQTKTQGPMARLKDILAQCPTFWAWAGVSNATDARARIHYEQANTTDTRPLAVVQSGSRAYTAAAGGAQMYQIPSGTLSVVFEMDIATANLDSANDLSDVDAANADLQGPIDEIVKEISEIAGTPGHLLITDMRQDSGPGWSDEDETEAYGQIVLEVDYGLAV